MDLQKLTFDESYIVLLIWSKRLTRIRKFYFSDKERAVRLWEEQYYRILAVMKKKQLINN